MKKPESFTSGTIKKYKGKMIRLIYTSKGERKMLTGEITASTRQHILFDVNKDNLEIPITYRQIINISKLKKKK